MNQLEEQLSEERRSVADLTQKLAIAERPITQPVLTEPSAFPGGATGVATPQVDAQKPQAPTVFWEVLYLPAGTKDDAQNVRSI